MLVKVMTSWGLRHAQAEVQCSIVGSSIALLTGQKPPFRLLARAVRGSTGERLPHIKPAVSDAFVVATQRVKTAQKVLYFALGNGRCRNFQSVSARVTGRHPSYQLLDLKKVMDASVLLF